MRNEYYSHNDYKNDCPIFDAMKENVIIFEVDIIRNLKICHNRLMPSFLIKRDLENSYLKPLNRINILMKKCLNQVLGPNKYSLVIDLKTSSRKIHKLLYDVLNKYAHLDIYITAGDNWLSKILGSRKKSKNEFLDKYGYDLNLQDGEKLYEQN